MENAKKKCEKEEEKKELLAEHVTLKQEGQKIGRLKVRGDYMLDDDNFGEVEYQISER